MLGITHEAAQQSLESLGFDIRTGQGIVIGPNTLGDMALQVYWISGPNSEPIDDVIPMKSVHGCHIAANGAHIQGIVAGMRNGQAFPKAFTQGLESNGQFSMPRIAGLLTVLDSEKEIAGSYHFSLARRGQPARIYCADIFTGADSGLGRCVTTSLEGSFLSSYGKDSQQDVLPLGEGVEDTAQMYWESLNKDAKLAVMVKGVHPGNRNATIHVIARDEWGANNDG